MIRITMLALAVLVVAPCEGTAQVVASRAQQSSQLSARRDSSEMTVRFGRITAALNTAELNTKRFLGITGLKPARLTFVDIRDWVTSDMVEAMDAAIVRNARAITAMRSELQNSLMLRDALVERDLTMSQVVAVDVSPDASQATVFYRKGSENRWP